MPLVKFAAESLVCHTEHLVSLPDWFTVGRRSCRFGDIVAFDVTGNMPAIAQLRSTATDDLPRIMDHFYLWTPSFAARERQLLLDALFEIAAAEFSHIVHPNQNRENIRNLLASIVQHYGGLNELRILDFGCGPGLSAAVAHDYGLELTGYDRCPKMRALAVQRGLRVLTPEEFATLPVAKFDATFASYVLHLGPSQGDLVRLWELLKPDGIVVANFHKDHGLSEVTACFAALGAETRKIEHAHSRFKHGSYWLYAHRS